MRQLAVLVIALTFFATSPQVLAQAVDPKPNESDFADYSKYLEEFIRWTINQKLKSLNADLAGPRLEDRVAELEASVERIVTGLTHLPPRGAFIDCNTSNYVQTLPLSGHLIFLVACERIEPYLEGYKLTLSLGNPHTVTFSNLNGSVGYGDTGARAWVQTKDWSTVGGAKAGSWTSVTVAITPAEAKDLRYVYLTFSVGAASLAR